MFKSSITKNIQEYKMHRADVAMLCSLPALWGASYLFIRVSADDFGAVPLAGMRVAGAALLLTPLLVCQGGLREMLVHWKTIAFVGITNCALPFVLLGFAALTIPANLSSIFSATSPLFAAIVAWLWLKEKIRVAHIVGLATGFAGVLWLVWDNTSLPTGNDDTSTVWAMIANLGATLLFGFSANFSRRHLGKVTPLAVATGSQIASAVVLALPSAYLWPATIPPVQAWGAIAMLATICTALGYLIYFRLIINVGPTRTVTIYFMVPAFGALWAALFLGEDFTLSMAFGCCVILIGMALATRTFPLRTRTSLKAPEKDPARNPVSGQ
jgi:drug/metabolite transporter (DMT)-like permease